MSVCVTGREVERYVDRNISRELDEILQREGGVRLRRLVKCGENMYLKWEDSSII